MRFTRLFPHFTFIDFKVRCTFSVVALIESEYAML